MADQQLVEYIKSSLAQGVSRESLSQALIASGWSQTQIDEALAVVKIATQAPAPAPLPAQSMPGQPEESQKLHKPKKPLVTSPYSVVIALVLVASLFILVNKIITDLDDKFAPAASGRYYQSEEYKKLREERFAIERGIDRTDNQADDFGGEYKQKLEDVQQREQALIQRYEDNRDKDITTKLILNAILIVPIWLLVFLMHFSFREHKRRFAILSGPYYLVGGFLLLRLLYDLSKYILSKNNAFGIYVVLIMVIAALTAVIIIVQRYYHKEQTT